MPPDPAQRHQIEQDAVTAAWEAERLAACDDAIALLREIAPWPKLRHFWCSEKSWGRSGEVTRTYDQHPTSPSCHPADRSGRHG